MGLDLADSIHLQVGGVDDRRPLSCLVSDERSEIRWRSTLCLGADLGQDLLYLLSLHGIVDGGVQYADDLRISTGGRKNA
jgi:hypothetical protein